MKKTLFLILWMSVVCNIGGCAASVRFNESYLPNLTPDHPAVQINLEDQTGRAISDYLNQTRISNFASLHWLKKETIFLNLEGAAVFAIDVAKQQVHVTDSAEADAAKKQIKQKVNISLNQEGLGTIMKLAASYLSYKGYRFTGEIRDNGHTLQVDVKTVEKRDASITPICESVTLTGHLTNARGQSTEVGWDFSCEWTAQATAALKVPQLLAGVQVSPCGRYYLHGRSLYKADQNLLIGDLLGGYRNVLAVSVNPSWTRMAVLRTKGKSAWIEIFPINLNEGDCSDARQIDS